MVEGLSSDLWPRGKISSAASHAVQKGSGFGPDQFGSKFAEPSFAVSCRPENAPRPLVTPSPQAAVPVRSCYAGAGGRVRNDWRGSFGKEADRSRIDPDVWGVEALKDWRRLSVLTPILQSSGRSILQF